MSSPRRLLLLPLLAALAGCSEPPWRQALSDWLQAQEQAAEAGDVATLMRSVGADFRSGDGVTRVGMEDYLTRLFKRHDNVHLLVHAELPEADPGTASFNLTLFVAMASTPLNDELASLRLRADAHRLDLKVRRVEDDFQVDFASWRRQALR